jgi:hypothetical protein
MGCIAFTFLLYFSLYFLSGYDNMLIIIVSLFWWIIAMPPKRSARVANRGRGRGHGGGRG